jgi:hypothetical protein
MVSAAAAPSAATTTTSAVPAPPTAAATTAAGPASATTSTTTSGTAAPSFAHRAGFIHHQRTAQKILAIAGLNGALGFFVVAKFREPETSRLTGEFIADNLNGIGLKSVPREPVL